MEIKPNLFGRRILERNAWVPTLRVEDIHFAPFFIRPSTPSGSFHLHLLSEQLYQHPTLPSHSFSSFLSSTHKGVPCAFVSYLASAHSLRRRRSHSFSTHPRKRKGDYSVRRLFNSTQRQHSRQPTGPGPLVFPPLFYLLVAVGRNCLCRTPSV